MDLMHLLYLNVAKEMLSLWTSSDRALRDIAVLSNKSLSCLSTSVWKEQVAVLGIWCEDLEVFHSFQGPKRQKVAALFIHELLTDIGPTKCQTVYHRATYPVLMENEERICYCNRKRKM